MRWILAINQGILGLLGVMLLFSMSNNAFATSSQSIVGRDAYIGIDAQYSYVLKHIEWKKMSGFP